MLSMGLFLHAMVSCCNLNECERGQPTIELGRLQEYVETGFKLYTDDRVKLKKFQRPKNRITNVRQNWINPAG